MTENQTEEPILNEEEEAQLDKANIAMPLLWYILVEPRAPQKKHGAIALPEEVVEQQEHLTCVARVLRVGPLAYTAQTKAHIDLTREPNKPKEGSYVIHGQYAGQKMRLSDDSVVLLLADTEILAVTNYPEAFRYYL